MTDKPNKAVSALVAIVGPTAAGKSALGIALARECNGEIVCCDSTQLYRRFTIGTGKVSAAEQAGIPHHMMDLLEPPEVFTAGDYRRRAMEVLEDLRRRGKLPVLTVGTGLYLRALLEGLADAPARSEDLRERLRKASEKRDPGYLHRVLKKMDAEAATRIGPRDTSKLIRAIEVCVLAGKPLTEIHRAGRARLEGFVPVKIGLSPPRKELYSRIESRVESMLAAGWMDEVKRLLDEGVSPASKPFKFIGYSELRAHLNGVIPLAEAVKAIQQSTRRYAKRQLTWFRKEASVYWLEGFGDDPAVLAAARTYLNEQLRPGNSFRAGA